MMMIHVKATGSTTHWSNYDKADETMFKLPQCLQGSTVLENHAVHRIETLKLANNSEND